MRRKKHRKQMPYQRTMWRAEGIVGLIRESVMPMDMMATMETLQIQMRTKMDRNPMMHQRGM